MIGFLKGVVAYIDETQITIENAGLGYACNVPNSVLSALKIGQEVKLHTHMAVREDDISLYGFLEPQDKNIFLRLLSVSGVGARVALSILSGLSGAKVIEAVTSGDVAALCAIKGIGKKTAERIVLELKDKLVGEFGSIMSDIINAGGSFSPVSSAQSDAITALMSLGYSKSEAMQSVSKIAGAEHLGVEEIILRTLKG